MCLYPQSVRVKPARDLKYSDHPRYLHVLSARGSELMSRLIPSPNDYINVPCGKCVECLRKRQNDIAVRASIEANKRGSMVFLTLTYNPQSLPLSVQVRYIDKDTGELYTQSPAQVLCSGSDHDEDLSFEELAFRADIRSDIAHRKKSTEPVVITRPLYETDTHIAEYTITPSVCRRDVLLWLKSSRVAFEREFGHKLPEFTYICCQEYGPKTCRPHAHLAFFGLEYKTVCWMAKRWRYNLRNGFYFCESVKAVNKDGSFGFGICAKYIAKYCTKGEFECPSVSAGLAQKPRLMISKNFGLSALTPALISYFRCDDLLGECNPFTLRFRDGSYLSENDARYIEEEVKKRAKWSLGSYSVSLPRSFVRKIWYFKDIRHDAEGKKIISFRAYPLRKALALFAYTDPVEEYSSKLLQDYPGISHGLFSSLVTEFIRTQETLKQARGEVARKYLQKQYCRSRY